MFQLLSETIGHYQRAILSPTIRDPPFSTPPHSHSIVLSESSALIFVSKFLRRTENFRLSSRQNAGLLILKVNSAQRKFLASRDYRYRSDDFLNLARERRLRAWPKNYRQHRTFLWPRKGRAPPGGFRGSGATSRHEQQR